MESRTVRMGWLFMFLCTATFFARDFCYVIHNGGKTMQTVCDERRMNDAPAVFQWADRATIWLLSAGTEANIAPQAAVGL